jgi:hypothetical protein
LSHLAWLVTYPIAGWLGTSAGFTATWSILLVLTAVGSVAALVLWPEEADADTRAVEVSAKTSFGDTLVGDEAQSAAGILAACQCSCVRPV